MLSEVEGHHSPLQVTQIMAKFILNLPLKFGCVVGQVYHEMVVLERIHTNPQFSPGVSLEALTRQPLRLH